MLTQGISSNFYHLFLERGESTCICDYYCCFDKKSEFIYMAKDDVKAIGLSKEFLLETIFPKYPI